MKPDVDQMLMSFLGPLITHVAPHLPEGYPAGSMGTMTVLMIFAAQEYERAADARMGEIDAMKEVFAEALAHLAPGPLKDAAAQAARSIPGDLKISTLNQVNDQMRRVLIDLHSHVEETPELAGGALEQAIWSVYRRMAEGRALCLPQL